MPQVSVLLPCRDAAPFLHECLRSLHQQTLSDFEIIAVDDGSADDTAYLLEQWSTREPRLMVVRSQPVGLVDALNAAFMRSTGAFIARMDADDSAQVERLEMQVAMLEAMPQVGVLGTHVRYFPEDVLRDGARAYQNWLNSISAPEQLARDLFVECPIAHPSLMIRRSVLQQLRGYRDEGWPEDYDLILRVVETGHQIANVPEVLHNWRERPDRLSRTDPRYSPEAFRRCKVHFLRRMLFKRRPVAVWGAGPVGKAFAAELKEQRVEVRCFIDIDPNKIGQKPHGIEVIGADGLDRIGDCFVVAAVGNAEARGLIRAALGRAGRVELSDFCAVA